MENVLKANLGVLKEVSRMISDETSCNIIICGLDGEIIEATLPERIGRINMGSKLILAGESDEAIITQELEEFYRQFGTDTRTGYDYVINVLGKRVGSLGVAGEPDFLKPIVRIAAKTIGFYITEYLREKEKNIILQKMASIAEDIKQKPFDEINYHIFADDIRHISGAKYVFFDLYDPKAEMSTIVAVAANPDDNKAINEFMGFNILGCQRKNAIVHRLNNNSLTIIDSIAESPCSVVPENKCSEFQQHLDIGQVCCLEIAHDDKMIGDFILFMPKRQYVQNTILVELYAAQVAQLLMRAQAEATLKKSEAKLKKTLSILDSFWKHSPNPICIMDQSGRIIRISQSGSDLLDKSPQELEGHQVIDTFQPMLSQVLMERLKDLKDKKEPVCFSDGVILKDGGNRYYDSWVFPIDHDDSSELLGIVALDVTDRKMNEERLKYISHHDSLTGIHNRTYFEKEIKRLTVSNEYPITILSLDADGLKIINDTMGHDRGDILLKNLAGILRRSLRECDILARVGGDEFVIILPRTESNTAQMIANRIKNNIQVYNQENPSLPISISIGLCTVEQPGNCLEEVLKKADEHMYRNKLFQKESSHSQIVNALMAALTEKEYIAQGHTQRLLDHCMKMGEQKKLSDTTMTALALLSQVHDLGKISIPDSILFKPESLTDEEWQIMRQHPEKGYRIAMVSSPDLKEVANLILTHHERWDGLGYPLGLKQEEIPIECRILSVADSFDAMVSERPYSAPKTKEEAITELERCAGSQFDPEVVRLFLLIMDT